MICGSGGSKSRLAKAAGAEPAGQRRDEKLHAVVARSTFPSQNVQNTPRSDHFWKLRCSTQQPQGTRYATCDEDATPHVGWVGMGWGWGTDNVPVDATQLTALRSNRRGQGTQHVMKMLRHMWVGWGWGGALINSC